MLSRVMTTGDTSFHGAAAWLESLLSGSLLVMVAMIAFWSLGLSMLRGRISHRRAGLVTLGAFVLLGSSMIAGGLLRVASSGESAIVDRSAFEPSQSLESRKAPTSDDPYAGASLVN